MPFLVVEFRGDRGSMWACTDQCLGGSASCVNIGTHLNTQLVSKSLKPFNSVVFSIAMNGRDASLFVSWKPDPDIDGGPDPTVEFYMQSIGEFALQDIHYFLVFRRCVRSIFDWGKGKRLDDVSRGVYAVGTKRARERDWTMSAVARVLVGTKRGSREHDEHYSKFTVFAPVSYDPMIWPCIIS